MKGYSKKFFNQLKDYGALFLPSEQLSQKCILSYAQEIDYNSMTKNDRDNAFRLLTDFLKGCYKLKLPINNPIAFFNHLYNEIDLILKDAERKKLLCALLQLVYSDCHFLFGNAFDSKSNDRLALRISDVSTFIEDTINEYGQEHDKAIDLLFDDLIALKSGSQNITNGIDVQMLEIITGTITSQSNLDTCYSYNRDFEFFSDGFEKLHQNIKLYIDYEKTSSKNNDETNDNFIINFRFDREIWLRLVKIYTTFFERTYYSGKETLEQINKFKQYCEIAFAISEFTFNANNKNLTNQEWSNICNDFKIYVLENRDKIIEFIEDDEFNGGCKEYIKYFIENIDNDYCMYKNLIGYGSPRNLSEEEKDAIEEFDNIPIVTFITKVGKELNKIHVQKTASYYLFDVLNNSGNLYAPFCKLNYPYKALNKPCECKPMSTDPTAVKNQIGSIWLFNALNFFCEAVFVDEFDTQLSEFMFEIKRGYVPHKKYFIYHNLTDEKLAESQYQFQHDIEQSLRQNLKCDVMCFQQYSAVQCGVEDFYQFYFGDDSLDKKVIKQLKRVITDDIVDDYCKKFIFKYHEYGASAQSVNWHKNMARFLDLIVESNEFLSMYSNGEQVGEIEVAPGKNFSDWEKVYLDEHRNKPQKSEYLDCNAKLQLAIHYICLEKAADKTRIKAMEILKKAFYTT